MEIGRDGVAANWQEFLDNPGVIQWRRDILAIAGDRLVMARQNPVRADSGFTSPFLSVVEVDDDGMIVAFQSIAQSGGNADPVLLAGGIGTALVTTFWGLLVAIPALAAYATIRNRIDSLATEASLEAQSLIEGFRPKPREASEASSAAERRQGGGDRREGGA